jgi:hypothetical protein
VCPSNSKLTFSREAEHHGKVMRLYKGGDCVGCDARRRAQDDNLNRCL